MESLESCVVFLDGAWSVAFVAYPFFKARDLGLWGSLLFERRNWER